jgi:phage baseplate assembly protein W
MADGITYGINFPFRQSQKGTYLNLTEETGDEIRANLIHLLLTRKGYRYYLPDFGTRLYEYIFEPLDGQTFDTIRAEIEESVAKYIPNLTIENITIEPYIETDIALGELSSEQFDIPVYRVPGAGTEEYTAKVKIEYTDDSSAFGSREFVIINL